MDFAQGAPQAPPQGGIPPELAGLLGAGGPPPEQVAPAESTLDILNRMIEDAKLYIDTD